MRWITLQVANSSYVWLPLLPREDGLGYTLLDLERWRPRDFMAQAITLPISSEDVGVCEGLSKPQRK